ncbi:MAG: DNA polymerase III subunit gamma/tau [Caulobacterales bacterium]
MSDESAPDGPNLFGEPTAKSGGYLVLARKYRPKTFEDLIGQEAMVRTIANSFALGRVPHAYVLTGVRGVGKTTTARLLARALNYQTDQTDRPSVKLEPLGAHCQAIMESRHPDVFEMDAASRTGINDIREILDSVRYAPVMARAKVYIIDEVHMLSVQAFNGLLKTLEEPPPHVKFIFATTEIRKVPVTVLSRCQRFDLKRVPLERMVAHLTRICAAEKVAVEPDGIALIARAAEGSVRDGLSLLDQALVQRGGGDSSAIRAAEIRDMLGLADRGRVLDLFEAVVRADAKAALTDVRDQYEAGADPALVLRDLLEVAHETARAQALGDSYAYAGGSDQAARVQKLARGLTPAQASRLWQMLLKALEEAGRAPEPIAAVEMAMVRICAAQGLPPPEEAARLLAQRSETSTNAHSTHSESEPDGPRLASFDDVVALIAERREAGLEIDVERYVRLVAFAPGSIRYQPAPGAPADLAGRLARFLKDWTGEVWFVAADDAAAGVESLEERRAREREAELAALRAHPAIAEALSAFPGATIAEVRKPKPQDGGAADVTPFKRPPPRSGSTRKEGAS